MVTKFLSGPLLIIMLMAFFSMLGLGDLGGDLDTTGTGSTITPSTLLYDSGGTVVCYANLTVITSASQWNAYVRWAQIPGTDYIGFDNSSNMINPNWGGPLYQLYYDVNATDPVPYQATLVFPGSSVGHFDIATSLGLIGVVGVLMAVGAVIGAHFLGSGESDISIGMILKSTGFLMLWGIFSILAMNILTQIPEIGVFLYFGLTGCYVIGIVDSIGSPSS